MSPMVAQSFSVSEFPDNKHKNTTNIKIQTQKYKNLKVSPRRSDMGGHSANDYLKNLPTKLINMVLKAVFLNQGFGKPFGSVFSVELVLKEELNLMLEISDF